ncbi:beta strand repeat-containing protein [Ancylobacter sp. IITR112]|uniref:beta strand repeat-containing protein n=1 Tax=Ancylobacter sp. IITR112 TaxID=3138073 RepID=UPI00352BB8FC
MLFRTAWLSVAVTMVMGLAAASHASDWGTVVAISSTMGVHGDRVCVGEATRGDIGCPTYAPEVGTDGAVSATRFIGDGAGLTGVVASTADRIVSGSTSLLAVSSTGFVSLTQAGTNTGWFDPTRGLVTLGVSSTGRISTTDLTVRGSIDIITGTESMFVGRFTTTANNSKNNVVAIGYGSSQNNSGSTVTAVGNYTAQFNAGSEVAAFSHAAAMYNAGNYLTAFGPYAAMYNSSSHVTAIGYGAAQYNSGSNVAGIGHGAAQYNNASYLSALGYNAAKNNRGDYVSAFGFTAARLNSSSYVTAMGAGAAELNSTPHATSVGYNVGRGNTGSLFTAMGSRAGEFNSGNNVAFVGYNAGTNNAGHQTVGIGVNAAANNTGANSNFIGNQAGDSNTGDNVNALGIAAAKSNTGTYLNAIGFDAARYNTGSHVEAMGYNSAISNTGSLVVAIGREAAKTNTFNNVVALGYNAQSDKANQIILGNSSIVEVSTAGVILAAGVSTTGVISATKFIGNGSGLTGVVASTADRIVSGSTSLLAVSSTGFVSLTQAGTNTGWFDPARGLVTLGVSATGAISGTRGYFRDSVGIGSGSIASGYALHVAKSGGLAIGANGATGFMHMFASNGTYWGVSPNSTGSALSISANSNSNSYMFIRNISGYAAGIGLNISSTAIPSATLHVSGTGYFSDNVGIGSISPTAPLDVSGTVSATYVKLADNDNKPCAPEHNGTIRFFNGRISLCRAH